LQATNYACIEVSDAGCGIADKDIETIFDPFFSSKFAGRGLGLAVVLGIVKAHSGLVTVESHPGQGSKFTVFLPVSVETVSRNPEPLPKIRKTRSSSMVLVVDDEHIVRNSVSHALKRLGYAVLTAADGQEALHLFQQHPSEIGCVLCDLTMPGMNGWETLTALRKLAPQIPIVLSSGYSEAQVMEGHHPELPTAFLNKPYDFRTLGDAIARIMK
jgi:CheY-like chemotaxis protein